MSGVRQTVRSALQFSGIAIVRRLKSFRYLSLALVACAEVTFSVAPSGWMGLLGTQSALAQRVRPDGVWQQVYQQLPDLPRENQYVNKETNKVDPDNTLVSRVIRYHIYVQGRSPFYRLDWKLTFAEYLGIDGFLEESTYPSRNTLKTSPLEGDVAAINRLSRSQRNALIQALVNAFTPQAGSSQLAPTSTTPRTPAAATPPAREPGSAQLLVP